MDYDDYNEYDEDDDIDDESESCLSSFGFTGIIAIIFVIVLLVGIIITNWWMIILGILTLAGIVIFKFNLFSTCGSGSSYTLDDIYDDDLVRKVSKGYFKWRHNNEYVHRWVAENYILGRNLEDNEVVHHIDGDHGNNEPNNLEVMDKRDHDKQHGYFWARK